MERLGGLMKRMPWTAAALLAGAVALAALPPGSGFTGKWLLYMSLIRDGFATTGGQSMTALLAVGLLALIGGLAAIALVRLTGIVLLGAPRSEQADHAHESAGWMLGPMLVLVVLCLVMAVAPRLAVNVLLPVAEQVLGWRAGFAALQFDHSQAPLAVVGVVNASILVVLGIAAWLMLAWSQRRVLAAGPTWGCGYVRPTARMQYTGRSFVEMLAEHLLPRFLRPHVRRQVPVGLFPAPCTFSSTSPDPVTAKVYEPFFRRWADRFAGLRVLQQGKIHIYLIYIFAMVVLALTWMSIRQWWGVS
jgi:NADH:ubiquinone oxidoreductase subunit 5 (subunit L)/multisubunit Na+/H+ antiporter MnhA subunit